MLARVNRKQLSEYVVLMVNKQKGKCAVCGNPFTARDDHVVDHCHYTGALRGALHRSCNAAEGSVLTMAERVSKGNGTRYIIRVAEKIRKGKDLTKVEQRLVALAKRCHSGVNNRVYLVGLARYYIEYAKPRHNLIHPSHHLKFERHDGIPMDKRNWRD